MASNYSCCHNCDHSNEAGSKTCVQCEDNNETTVERDNWACRHCTYLNEGFKNRCSACRSRKNGYSQCTRGKSRYASELDNEVRIVLLGKTGSGKSATGNVILNGDVFESTISGSSVTSRCTSRQAQRFGRNIQIVDTPGIFDTNKPNDVVQREIVKCIGITSPGPHCFLLVLGLSRFTQEEEESINHFVNYFGEGVFRYFIVLFTRKDDLDHHGKTLDDHLRTVLQSLKTIIAKCDHRCIAFNNRAPIPAKHDQVEDLLKMIDDIVSNNHGDHYTNEMYSEAEKVMKHRQHQIENNRKKEREQEREAMKSEIEEKYKIQTRSHLKKENELELRVAELESMQEYQFKQSSALEKELLELEKEMESERRQYGSPSSRLLSKHKRLEEERLKLGSAKESETKSEIEELRNELKRMHKESKKMAKEKERMYQRQIRMLEKKHKESENARVAARVEVENGTFNIGEFLLGGIMSIGKLVWKGIQGLF